MAEWLVLFSVIWLVRKKVCCTCQGFFFFLVIRSAYHLYGKPGNSGENSNGTVYPGGNFPGKKNNTFRGITFFPFLPKQPEYSVPFFCITSAKLQVERKRKIYLYFLNGTLNPVPVFGAKKNTSTI